MVIWLETERLRLRQVTADDADLLVALDADPEVVRFVGGRHTTPADARERMIPHFLGWHAQGPDQGFWIAERRDTGQFLGWFHFRPPNEPDVPGVELGYRLVRSAWNRGLATEGSAGILEKAFGELGLERVCAKTLAVNAASRRVMEKVGLRYERSFMETRIDPSAEAVWYAASAAEYESFIKGL